jgi:hypothetical protein
VLLNNFTGWTAGATEVAHDHNGEATLSWGGGSPSADVTVSCTLGSDGGVGAIVVKAAAAGGASQFARPSSDVAVGGWNNQVPNQTDVFESINETAALLSDTDYVQSGAAPVDDTLIVGLTAINPPGAGTVTIRIRAKFL